VILKSAFVPRYCDWEQASTDYRSARFARNHRHSSRRFLGALVRMDGRRGKRGWGWGRDVCKVCVDSTGTDVAPRDGARNCRRPLPP